MSVNAARETSRLTQSLCFEIPTAKKTSKDRLEYLDLSLDNKASKTIDTSPFKQVLGKITFLETLGIGIGTGVMGSLLGDQIVSLSGKTGAIPDFDYQKMMTEMCVTIVNTDNFVINACFIGPILEELIFRYSIQQVLLKEIPEKIIKIIAPGKEDVLDSKVAKITRTLFTAALFGYIHIVNQGRYPDAYCYGQIISSFVGGIAFGILKESKVGLLGSIVAHVSNNIFSFIETVSYC